MSIRRQDDTDLAIRERYTGESGRSYHENRFAIPDDAYDWVARQRARKFASHLSPGGTVVEFGVGHGWNLAALRCRERIGFDVAAHVAPVVRKHGIAFVERSEDLPSATADVLICHHVLEHVPHPAATLKEIQRVLARGGRLLLFVPYEVERRQRRYVEHELDHHLFSWTPQTLGNLVRDCGFSLSSASIGRSGYDRVAAVWAHRLGFGELGFRALRGLGLMVRPVREVRIVAIKD